MSNALLKIAAAVLVATSATAAFATERHKGGDDRDGKRWEYMREGEFCREAFRFLKKYGDEKEFRIIKVRFVRECRPYWVQWKQHHHNHHPVNHKPHNDGHDRDDCDDERRKYKPKQM